MLRDIWLGVWGLGHRVGWVGADEVDVEGDVDVDVEAIPGEGSVGWGNGCEMRDIGRLLARPAFNLLLLFA
jgi:hypothetical protein